MFPRGVSNVCVDEDFKDQWPYLQAIAVAEELIAQHQLPVEKGAIEAAEIADQRFFLGDPQQAMLSADQGAIGADIALASPAEDEFAQGKRQAMAPRVPLEDFQLQLHPESFQDGKA
jgi:hypothetical protein